MRHPERGVVVVREYRYGYEKSGCMLVYPQTTVSPKPDNMCENTDSEREIEGEQLTERCLVS